VLIYNCFNFNSAATLLAMQSTVLATAILSVCLSVRLSQAGIVPRQMKIESCGLYCEVAKHCSFFIPTMVLGATSSST